MIKKLKLSLLGFILALPISLSLAVSQIALAEETRLPPGVSKQGRVPGEGRQKGWEQGQHKGWEKNKPEECKESKDQEEMQAMRKKRQEEKEVMDKQHQEEMSVMHKKQGEEMQKKWKGGR
jgi:hypothetical protein